MKNVYDIRYEENLTFILPEKAYADAKPLSGEIYNKTAVIIYLYYIDTVTDYYRYIDNIVPSIDLYIISSREEVLEVVREHIDRSGRRNVQYILKENRGRDVSALLIASRDIVKKYLYVCFLHDKKEHEAKTKKDIDLWIENLWGNQIGSPDYIDEILRLFEQKENLGIIAPPEPIGDHINTWFGYGWYESYDITKQIVDKMALHTDIRWDKPPITFGTVLWFRTKALIKLFDMDWEYSDFQDELLQNEKYLSYGRERSFAYVAQDAGYETGTAMTISYAQRQTGYLQYSGSRLMHAKDEFFPISYIDLLNRFMKRRETITKFCRNNRKLYLYGAGKMGLFCLEVLQREQISPDGYIVTEDNGKSTLWNYPIILLDELKAEQDIGVIITVERKEIQEEIARQLEKKGYRNYIKFWDREAAD